MCLSKNKCVWPMDLLFTACGPRFCISYHNPNFNRRTRCGAAVEAAAVDEHCCAAEQRAPAAGLRASLGEHPARCRKSASSHCSYCSGFCESAGDRAGRDDHDDDACHAAHAAARVPAERVSGNERPSCCFMVSTTIIYSAAKSMCAILFDQSCFSYSIKN